MGQIKHSAGPSFRRALSEVLDNIRRMARPKSIGKDSSAHIGFEAKLWLAADKRSNLRTMPVCPMEKWTSFW